MEGWDGGGWSADDTPPAPVKKKAAEKLPFKEAVKPADEKPVDAVRARWSKYKGRFDQL